MNTPLLTIIIPLKDRLSLLKETINAIKFQSSTKWQTYLIDDGSNEETMCFLEDLTLSDNRFHLFIRKNGYSGPNSCRNLGVKNSNTKYILFLDSDDILGPHAISQRIKAMENNNDLDFSLFSTRVFYTNINETFPWFEDWNGTSELDRLLKMDWPINISSPTWNRKFLLNAGLFDETLLSWDDWEMHTRILIGNPKFLRFNEEADFFIRATESSSRLSSIQYTDSLHLQNAIHVFLKITHLLKEKNLLTSDRAGYLAKQFFSTAYLSLNTDGIIIALKRLRESKILIPDISKSTYITYLIRLIYCYAKRLKKF